MLIDPERFDLRGTLEHGKDVEIDVNVIVEGNVRLGDRVKNRCRLRIEKRDHW